MADAFNHSLTSLRAVTELGGVLGGFAARKAAWRIVEGADKRPLLDAFARLNRAAGNGDYPDAIAADRQLHLLVVRAAGVETLETVWEAVANAMGWLCAEAPLVVDSDLMQFAEGHRQLVDAICMGDAVAAERAAMEHMEAVWRQLAEHTGDASLPNDPLSRACSYIALHLDEPIRLSFLAKHLAKTSPGHLARLFQEKHGVCFTEYLRGLRMQKAGRLVSETSEPIRRVAALVAYDDPSRFAEHFRRHHGLSPQEYRRRHRGPSVQGDADDTRRRT